MCLAAHVVKTKNEKQVIFKKRAVEIDRKRINYKENKSWSYDTVFAYKQDALKASLVCSYCFSIVSY